MTAVDDLNPFVGLRPFEADDSVLFFGRKQQSSELLDRLHQSRFVSVVGSSGCGKSSLVRAGLIPRLQGGFLVNQRDIWYVHTMKPGDAPIDNLALALTKNGHDNRAEAAVLAEHIQEGGVQTIIDATEARFAGGDANLLLLVDQFEEVFRFNQPRASVDSEGASDFVSMMLDLAAQRDVPIYVIMTMRSDFLGDCDRFLGLPEAMNRSQYLVPRLTRQQRREAIEGPIKLHGGQIAPRLIDRLLNESIDARDDLPVLQHALMRTWDAWRRDSAGPMDLSHYEAIGTLNEALSKDAEAALTGMTERQLVLTERLFQALTTVDAVKRRIRKPAKLFDVAMRAGTTAAELWPIVERFRSEGRSFLVVSSEQTSDNPLIDISHESLIRQWNRLGTWVNEEAESIGTYKRLAETAALHNQERAGLYRDQDLQVALDWRANEQPNASWAKDHHEGFAEAMAFLDESKAIRDEERDKVEFARQWRVGGIAIGGIVLGIYLLNPGLLDGSKASIEEVMRAGIGVLSAEAAKSTTIGPFAQATQDVARFGFYALLFVALNAAGKRLYRRFLFNPETDPVAAALARAARRQDSKMKKIRRIFEEVAKWSSILVGTLILGSCSMIGASAVAGSQVWTGVFTALGGLVFALTLVGWVFAVARLNADVKAIRKEIHKDTGVTSD